MEKKIEIKKEKNGIKKKKNGIEKKMECMYKMEYMHKIVWGRVHESGINNMWKYLHPFPAF